MRFRHIHRDRRLRGNPDACAAAGMTRGDEKQRQRGTEAVLRLLATVDADHERAEYVALKTDEPEQSW